MNIIVKNGFAFRIPEIPSRYRANCSKDFGCFVTGETNGLNILECQQKGLTKGKYVELAICWVANKTLTFQPNYINEQFTEIWGIPVSGEMKDEFNPKASQLITFLIHRQSKDKLSNLLEDFNKEAFNSWVEDGMNGDIEEYTQEKSIEFYFSNIFRFEMTKTEGKFGTYHYVKTSVRSPESELDKAALEAAKEIFSLQPTKGYCNDIRLIQNEMQCLGEAIEEQTIEALPATNNKRLKVAK